MSENAEVIQRLADEEAELEDILADAGRFGEEAKEAFEAAAATLADSERNFTG